MLLARRVRGTRTTTVRVRIGACARVETENENENENARQRQSQRMPDDDLMWIVDCELWTRDAVSGEGRRRYTPATATRLYEEYSYED